MSGLFNFIKSLFSGIFGFIGGLFGSKKASAETGTESQANSKKKNNGYFLELDDAKSVGTTASEASAAQPVAVASVGQPEPQPAQPAKTTRKEKLAAAAKASEKPAAKKTAEKPAATPAKAPKPVAATASANAAKPEVAFATKYLISPNNGGRRRPGANMSPYLTMARQMGVR
ncbi:MAG: hypothetical protein HC866_24660 [Leptolyngbyaceae cyanobacterium RU_5_1]|nr:hypothetical protein [Leptolyngbyaceae cyanobacterium RU_5_1]